MLLSDTVGFLRKLPHGLIASFHATLEEAATADLLLHVADASHPNVHAHIHAVEEVLGEIGAGETPVVLVLNKVDRIESPLELRVLRADFPAHAAISAAKGTGIGALEHLVAERIDERREDWWVTVPLAEGRLLSRLSHCGTLVNQEEPVNGCLRVRVRLDRADAGRLRKEFEGDGVRFERIVG